MIGGIQLRKYHQANQAFRQFVPTWDSTRGMYDQFALELNAWYETDETPACCDGDTLYFLKLQKDRLKKKRSEND